MTIVHGACEHFWSRLFRAEAASFAIINDSTVRVLCMALGLRVIILQVALLMHLGF
jgi:hypothetical protein